MFTVLGIWKEKRKWVYLFLRSFPGPGYETLSLLLLSFSFRCWPDEVAPGQDPSSSSRGVKRRYVLSLSRQHVVIFPTFLFFFFCSAHLRKWIRIFRHFFFFNQFQTKYVSIQRVFSKWHLFLPTLYFLLTAFLTTFSIQTLNILWMKGYGTWFFRRPFFSLHHFWVYFAGAADYNIVEYHSVVVRRWTHRFWKV